MSDPAPRYPSLDGLRGFAAVAVIFNHLGPQSAIDAQWWSLPIVWAAEFGWIGVDLFFVLSGFLITGILIENRTASNYFAAFYAHRALRILPVYFLLLLINTVIIPVFFPAFFATMSTPGLLWPHWLFLTSLWLVNSHIGMAWVTYLGPTWSLSIEEQFYLIWAPIVRWLNNKQLFLLAVAVLFAGILLRCVLLPDFDPRYLSQVVFFTLTHLDGLCIGIILRLAFNSREARPALHTFAKSWWIWVALVAAIFAIDSQIGRLGVSSVYGPVSLRVGFTAIALMFAAIVANGILVDGWIRSIFDWKILRQLGSYSYFMYLFHWTVGGPAALAITSYIGNPGKLWLFAIQFVLTVAMAHLSFVAIERPAMRMRRRFPFRDSATSGPGHQKIRGINVTAPVI